MSMDKMCLNDAGEGCRFNVFLADVFVSPSSCKRLTSNNREKYIPLKQPRLKPHVCALIHYLDTAAVVSVTCWGANRGPQENRRGGTSSSNGGDPTAHFHPELFEHRLCLYYSVNVCSEVQHFYLK